MEWILVLITIFTFALVYIVIEKIDKIFSFFDEIKFTNKEEMSNKLMIVYGKSDFGNSLLKILNEGKDAFIHIEEEELINIEESYVCIFAVDKDDFNNLFISRIAKARFNINNQVILCNDSTYENIFIKNGHPFVYANDDPEKMIMIAKIKMEVKESDKEMDK